jgi:hypothetical protein
MGGVESGKGKGKGVETEKSVATERTRGPKKGNEKRNQSNGLGGVAKK